LIESRFWKTDYLIESFAATAISAKFCVVIPSIGYPRLDSLSHRRSIRIDRLKRPASAHLIGLAEVRHSLPLHDRRHHFCVEVLQAASRASIAGAARSKGSFEFQLELQQDIDPLAVAGLRP
jgi:hypothetical protein